MASNEIFRIEQIRKQDCDELAALARCEGGDSLLRPADRAVCDAACRDHSGLLVRAPGGAAVGSCLASRLVLPFQRATHWAPDEQLLVYLERFVVAKGYRGRGLGQALLRATIAFEYGRSDGPFPDVGGVAFADTASGALDAVGVLRFDERSPDLGVHRTMLALRTMMQQNQKILRFSRRTEIQILDMQRMPAIARWAIAAYSPDGIYDEAQGTTVRIVDPSEGRSGVVGELECLANHHPHALARIGLDAFWSRRAS